VREPGEGMATVEKVTKNKQEIKKKANRKTGVQIGPEPEK